jgi:L-2-hydroxyglutarate oxidase
MERKVSQKKYNMAIIGGGIVGMGTALAFSEKKNLRLLVIEAEDELAKHQTGNNSGVIHSGLYYKPGSLKALNCVEGREAIYRFCKKYKIAHDKCGKVVVATREDEIPALNELERRGRANGIKGLKRLTPEGIKEYEPHVTGIDGLYVPETGIVDFTGVTNQFAALVQERGGEVRKSTKLTGLKRIAGGLMLETTKGEFDTRYLISCAGLQSDRVTRLCGVDPKCRIIPFRGEYYELKPESQHLVKNLIYPVPDPRFPFLGVHFTRMMEGGVEAGPNAVFAFKREGYKKTSFSVKDSLPCSADSGKWRASSGRWAWERWSDPHINRPLSKHCNG